jgi:hypothetical protein
MRYHETPRYRVPADLLVPTPQRKSLLEELIVAQLIKKFVPFMVRFTAACH